ncbi:MAG: hypothetical protein COZ06_25535 [Armatimonadetes bacterium CG_4_10_14_3_um_filter_66_18]|nr:Stp1/IreP family PP2C-type Ser/Thr phosphatase [Armatimonadota bacterium]OIO98387.1 MAG: hypothetical protein AUJ96_21355 [Armatimonadetes bacterium CG2_30_66_41]PIU87625.1 MAG: hypothetical protein COS65_33810 [Armatimonadetes bacterium CG06_land_8_20_14_3_00_66_21]PIW13161.1 MAG: hypothetical protein COW34_11070 [Armatimonadetes bacterium CG17_big_fil_post_rev_8_21_14_2_50_66_6]PIX42824.1 MAG: hypothetical protein COZ57_20630 [Armatimonadetes bacterium CG_4_8_14_3_um_filter_66_20]PIY42280
MNAAGKTDVGRLRTNNEDAYAVHRREGLLMVADGMGGHEAGEVASQQAVELICRVVSNGGAPESNPRARLRKALGAANDEILRAAQQRGNNMGTTATVALILEDRLHVAQVGDSRAYLLRDGELTQLTEDHSVVQELVTAGLLSREGAEVHPHRNVLTRALGQTDDIEVDVATHVLQPEDLLLLCTDGLTTMLSDEEIRSTLATNTSLDETADALVKQANDRGGNDNITVVVANGFVSPPKPARRRFSFLPLLSLLGLSLVASAAYLVAANTFFLGPQGERVALYRGLPLAVGKHRLASVVATTPVRLDALGVPYGDRIRRGLLVESPAAGQALLNQLAMRPLAPEQT